MVRHNGVPVSSTEIVLLIVCLLALVLIFEQAGAC